MKKLNDYYTVDFYRQNEENIKMSDNEKALINKRILFLKNDDDLKLLTEKKILEIINNTCKWEINEW